MELMAFRAAVRGLLESRPSHNPKAQSVILNCLRQAAGSTDVAPVLHNKQFKQLRHHVMEAYIESSLLRNDPKMLPHEAEQLSTIILRKANSLATTSLEANRRTSGEDQAVELSRQFWHRLLRKAGVQTGRINRQEVPQHDNMTLSDRVKRVKRGEAPPEEAAATVNHFITQELRIIIDFVTTAGDINESYISNKIVQKIQIAAMILDAVADDTETPEHEVKA